MAEIVFVIGPSGSGKTSSVFPNETLNIQGLNPEETLLISFTSKSVPKKFYLTSTEAKEERYSGRTANRVIVPKTPVIANKIVSRDVYTIMAIKEFLKNPKFKNIVLDDFQYLSVDHIMANAMTKGYEKFTENGKMVFDVLSFLTELPTHLIAFILAHDEAETVNYKEERSLKLAGKMVKNTVGKPEGLSNTVLFTDGLVEPLDEGNTRIEKFFITQNDGTTTAKSLPGMFPYRIKNDLGIVEKALREYFD